MRLTKVLTMLLIICTLSCCLFGQITGQGIPDATAERLYMLHLTNLASSDLQAYLTNNVGLSTTDAASATSVLNNFKTAYASVVTTYNNGVVAGDDPSNDAFNTSIARVAASGYAGFQTALSSGGYTSLASDIQSAKNFMTVSNSPQTAMACCYNSVETHTLIIVSEAGPTPHFKLATSMTLEGSNGNNAANIFHTGNVTIHIGNEGAITQGTQHVPTYYINLQATAYLDSNSDTCLFGGGQGCDDTSESSVYCTVCSCNAFLWPAPVVRWEIAFTKVAETGGPRGACTTIGGVVMCMYPVRNWCNSSTTPPDHNFTNGFVQSANLEGYWNTYAVGMNQLGVWFWFPPTIALPLDQTATLAWCTKT